MSCSNEDSSSVHEETMEEQETVEIKPKKNNYGPVTSRMNTRGQKRANDDIQDSGTGTSDATSDANNMPPPADACKPPAAKTTKLGPKQRNELKELKEHYAELVEENRRLKVETPDEKLEEILRLMDANKNMEETIKQVRQEFTDFKNQTVDKSAALAKNKNDLDAQMETIDLLEREKKTLQGQVRALHTKIALAEKKYIEYFNKELEMMTALSERDARESQVTEMKATIDKQAAEIAQLKLEQNDWKKLETVLRYHFGISPACSGMLNNAPNEAILAETHQQNGLINGMPPPPPPIWAQPSTSTAHQQAPATFTTPQSLQGLPPAVQAPVVARLPRDEYDFIPEEHGNQNGSGEY